MTSSTALLPSVRAAFGSLIDYAGLFPPAALPLAQAQAEYRDARRGPHAWMLGRFIIPAATLATLTETFDAPISAIVEPESEALSRVAQLREGGAKVDALEIPLGEAVAPFREHFSFDEMLDVLGALETELVCSGTRDLPAFVEIPRTQPWQRLLPETLNEIARLALAAKIRRCRVRCANSVQGDGWIAPSGAPARSRDGVHDARLSESARRGRPGAARSARNAHGHYRRRRPGCVCVRRHRVCVERSARRHRRASNRSTLCIRIVR